MDNEVKFTCHHTDDVVATKTRLSTVEKRQIEESAKHETYRKDVHKRLEDVHSVLNLSRHDYVKQIEGVNRRVDGIEHITQNQSELLSDFKIFIGEATETFTSIKDYMIKQEAKSNLKTQIMSYTVKLAAFALTVLSIVKYIKNT